MPPAPMSSRLSSIASASDRVSESLPIMASVSGFSITMLPPPACLSTRAATGVALLRSAPCAVRCSVVISPPFRPVFDLRSLSPPVTIDRRCSAERSVPPLPFASGEWDTPSEASAVDSGSSPRARDCPGPGCSRMPLLSGSSPRRGILPSELGVLSRAILLRCVCASRLRSPSRYVSSAF